MIVNPEKCQVILIDKKRQSNDHTEIKVNGKHIKSDGSVTLLGIENDKQIKFWKAYFYALQQKRRSNKYFNQVKIL